MECLTRWARSDIEYVIIRMPSVIKVDMQYAMEVDYNRSSSYLKLRGSQPKGNGIPEIWGVWQQQSEEKGQSALAAAVHVRGTFWKNRGRQAWLKGRDKGVTGQRVYNSEQVFWLGHGKSLNAFKRRAQSVRQHCPLACPKFTCSSVLESSQAPWCTLSMGSPPWELLR